ncbi:hypothetical protein QE152_g9456 [Popillia japonica]|uniref:Uncharacterized protein n=1 Tax=Popillia japonica TaxID=7064 RepID=A0AAW1LYL8_POPJA
MKRILSHLDLQNGLGGVAQKSLSRNIALTQRDTYKSYAYLGLQSLLDDTVTRIFQTKTHEELADIKEEVTLISKWGCDASSGHSEYKQTFAEENVTEANMFLTSMVPLRLSAKDNEMAVYWKNAKPSTTRYCRPIQLQFTKETIESINNEIGRMDIKIAHLNETDVCTRKLHKR